MDRFFVFGLTTLLASTALADECTNPPYTQRIADFADQSSFYGKIRQEIEPIELHAQETLSPEGLAGLIEVLCAAEQIEEERYRNRYIQGILMTVLAPDPQNLENGIERFSTRLDMNIPDDAVFALRLDLAHLEANISARRMVLVEDLAERQAFIDAQEERVRNLDAIIAEQEARIAEQEARIAEIRAETAEIRAETAEIRAETAEIRANILRLREIRGELEGMINVLQGSQPLSALE